MAANKNNRIASISVLNRTLFRLFRERIARALYIALNSKKRNSKMLKVKAIKKLTSDED